MGIVPEPNERKPLEIVTLEVLAATIETAANSTVKLAFQINETQQQLLRDYVKKRLHETAADDDLKSLAVGDIVVNDAGFPFVVFGRANRQLMLAHLVSVDVEDKNWRVVKRHS